jgi:hypothetical protein
VAPAERGAERIEIAGPKSLVDRLEETMTLATIVGYLQHTRLTSRQRVEDTRLS